MKMTRCPEECRKQWRLVQGKLEWEKQKEEEKKEEVGKKREDKETEKGKDNGGKEDCRTMGNMG